MGTSFAYKHTICPKNYTERKSSLKNINERYINRDEHSAMRNWSMKIWISVKHTIWMEPMREIAVSQSVSFLIDLKMRKNDFNYRKYKKARFPCRKAFKKIQSTQTKYWIVEQIKIKCKSFFQINWYKQLTKITPKLNLCMRNAKIHASYFLRKIKESEHSNTAHKFSDDHKIKMCDQRLSR